MKSEYAKSKRTPAMLPLAGLAVLCLLQCNPTGTGDEGGSGELKAAPGEEAPVVNADGFAPMMKVVLPGANPERQQAYAHVDATSLMVRSAPRRDAKAIHRLENQEPVEVVQASGETQNIDGATGRWTKIRAIVVKRDRPALVEGWVFGGYLTKDSDGEYQRGPAAGDHAPVWKMRPAEYPFDPRGKSYSYGVACSGLTFSEYGLEMDFGAASAPKNIAREISITGHNAMVHDSTSPSGAPCSTIERRRHIGSYSIEGAQIRIHFTRRNDEDERFGESEGDTDECAKVERRETKVDLADEYTIAYCYTRGRTVPGIIAPIPGDDADRIPAFWALIPE